MPDKTEGLTVRTAVEKLRGKGKKTEVVDIGKLNKK
jgi:hypothetical protein